MEQSKYVLNVYPALDGWIGLLDLPAAAESKVKMTTTAIQPQNSNKSHFIVVLDRSGSMGDQSQRLVQLVLPVSLHLMGPEVDRVTLITFDSPGAQRISHYTPSELARALVGEGGNTAMKPALALLQSHLLSSVEPGGRVRLLTLSDGLLDDQDETARCASELSALCRQRQLMINSQAIRFFTSAAQPDTRGLASMLQLNTLDARRPMLVDISAGATGNPEIAEQIARLFLGDGLTEPRWALSTSPEAVLCDDPWLTDATRSKMHLSPGSNTLWLKSVPKQVTVSSDCGTNDDAVRIVVHQHKDLNRETLHALLRTKIESLVDRLKVLKVVNTEQSRDESARITRYFRELEDSLRIHDVDLVQLLQDGSLRSRLLYFQKLFKQRELSVAARMLEIANNDKVAQFNSAQQADFLRTLNVGDGKTASVTGRGLAKRALNRELDFDAVLQREVRAMREHLDELKQVDDSSHLRSFYSQCTTVEGIRALCELSAEVGDALTAGDALKMLNLVGVAVDAPVGDYPDPMTWRVNRVFVGCYVSLGDVLTAQMLKRGDLHATGSATGRDCLIVNVLPLFDDQRVLRFLRHHAPTLLEYTCSVGMRRMIADIPLTFAYTICAGVWRMVEELDRDKSELNIETFARLVHSYRWAVGNYFAHVVPHLKRPMEKEEQSMYLCNNGITNLISPLMTLIEEKSAHPNLPYILRALHSYEVWQAVKRQFKSSSSSNNNNNKDKEEQEPMPEVKQEVHHPQPIDERIATQLNTLLGIDLVSHRTAPSTLFEKEPDKLRFYDVAHIDSTLLKDITKRFYYVKYVVLLPKLLDAVLHQPQDQWSKVIKQLPTIDKSDVFCTAMGIEYDHATFELYHIVQALLHPSKSSRVDSDNEQMHIIDVIDQQRAEQMIQDYVRKQYENHYNSEIRTKSKREREVLKMDLVSGIVGAPSIDQAVELWRNGLQRGASTNVRIENSSSQGFVELRSQLLDLSINVPCRAEKLLVLLLGRAENDGNVVWNRGNVLITAFADVERVLRQLGEKDRLDAARAIYLQNAIHVYRNADNRHGHSNNKPSYWALGYPTLEAMMENISPDEWTRYKEVHHHCCGVNLLN